MGRGGPRAHPPTEPPLSRRSEPRYTSGLAGCLAASSGGRRDPPGTPPPPPLARLSTLAAKTQRRPRALALALAAARVANAERAPPSAPPRWAGPPRRAGP